jgi:hypothetical protein
VGWAVSGLRVSKAKNSRAGKATKKPFVPGQGYNTACKD